MLGLWGLVSCSSGGFSGTGPRHRVTCHGNTQTWLDCERRANQICEEGFVELSRRQQAGHALTLGVAIPAWERALVIRCR